MDGCEQMGVTAVLCHFKEGISVVEVVRAPIKGLPRMQASKGKGFLIYIDFGNWVSHS